MIASGQFGYDIQKSFIKKNKEVKSEQTIDYPQKKLRETKPLDEVSPEEGFKNVGKRMYLNQSAMIPKEAVSSPSSSQTQAPSKEKVATKKLEDLAGKADNVLLKVTTIWPFTLFVNDIIIDPYKVSIIFREFFWSEHIHSVMIKDILDVVVETSVFFATVRIVDQGYIENTIDIAYLKRDDAIMVRKIIQGLVIAHRQAVDLSVLSSSHIRQRAEEMGQVKGIDDTVENRNNI